ncbi:transcriptional regulator, AraC family [Methylophaga frappieri]|uniref:Transcriptional regulator, AraC family n=1 Tax=Methylophaga frappieri (strain ATCC BAA-2434 / DSM 25690 / JAM7) TaxID=754477 RepID=I1YF46_METFJ|nr:AraC family transcriptional regulator [Methylophaga frappieri]AFJ01539.1 transcriptional regulator, AraC family [Methylophaga frappieri]
MSRLKQPGYELDTAFIPAHYQPALLVELAIARGADSRQLLRGTRLSLADLESHEVPLSPDQFLTLIGNTEKLLDADDSSFMFGQQLLPGFYGACSQTLQMAGSCRQLVEFMCEFKAVLSPLITPRFYETDEGLVIYWQDSCGADTRYRFILEASIAAFASLLDWLSPEKICCRYEFNYTEPDYIEQYWVHIGQNLSFDQQMNAIIVPTEKLDMNWTITRKLPFKGTVNSARVQLMQLGWHESFVDQVYQYLMAHIREPINLDRVSTAFMLSPASMKRKLKKHHTHFQQLLDLARKNTAIYLYQAQKYDLQQIADYLCFNDMNNFRRAVKRWTGFSPNVLFA